MKNQILSGKRFYNANEATSLYLEKTDLFPKEKIAFNYIPPHAKILDLGCGTGRTTGYFKKNGYDVIAIDISTAMIRTAKNQNLATPFLVGNASFLSIKSEIFDVVVFSFNGIDYIYPYAQRLKALQEIKRVLKPGGLFIFSAHNHCIPRDRQGVLPFFQFIFKKKRNTYINTFYAWGGMKMYLTTPTLQIKELNEMGFNPARIVTRRLLRHVKSLKFIGLIDNYVYYICRK
jgi:SAM-dependent methyltransferase